MLLCLIVHAEAAYWLMAICVAQILSTSTLPVIVAIDQPMDSVNGMREWTARPNYG